MISRIECERDDELDEYESGKKEFLAVSPVSIKVKMGDEELELGPRKLFEILRVMINRNMLRFRVSMPNEEYRRVYTIGWKDQLQQVMTLDCMPSDLCLLDQEWGGNDAWDWDDTDCLMVNNFDTRRVHLCTTPVATGLKATKVKKDAKKKGR